MNEYIQPEKEWQAENRTFINKIRHSTYSFDVNIDAV